MAFELSLWLDVLDRRCRGVGRALSSKTRSRTLSASLALGVSLGLAQGQGTLKVLQTGGGQPLVTSQEELSLAGIPSPTLLFDIGFVTEEVFSAGSFFDSFTVTLQNASGSQTAVILTVDVGGALWAPSSPGALPIPEGQIQRLAITAPSESPISGRGVAYSVSLAVPQLLLEPALDVYFDLSDNQNSAMSWGWYNNLRAEAVPEPGGWALLGVAGAMGLWRWRPRT